MICQCCASDALHSIAGFGDLPRVTSDSKPFAAGGRLFVCIRCGLAQKIVDAAWLREIEAIYAGYEMHHQSGTHDQVVFDPVSGAPAGRCEVLVRRLAAQGALPAAGSALDVGTGSGAMVAALSAGLDGWSLHALDLDDRKVGLLKRIPRFGTLFTCPPAEVQMQFDLVTLVHVLEHFTEPARMLGDLRGRLAPGGRLFVEVNNAARTPFDFIVADHLCHFTAPTLHAMAERAGFSVEVLQEDWIAKELTLLARPGAAPTVPAEGGGVQAIASTTAAIAWLQSLLADAARLAAQGSFGIFGTSIAATWLAGILGDKLAFFVDEDPAREGRDHLGRPVYRPAQAPAGASVYLAFPTPIAQSIAKRLGALPLRFELPQAAP